MKIYLIIGLAFGLSHTGWSQQAPTISNPPNGGQNDPNNWSRAGNLGSGVNNQNNLFGTKWNSPIYTITGNNFNSLSYRMKVNGNFTQPNQYSINGFTGLTGINTTGYILMGNNTTTGGQSIYQNKGAFSLLHLNGNDGAFVQEFGFRPWMKTGITFTDNQDLSYFGIRKVEPNSFDVTETTISWSDNAGVSSVGPDDMVFRFTGGSLTNGAGAISSNLNTTNDLDGLHVARYTGEGMMGLGNTFGINVSNTPGTLYNRPRSHFHMSQQFLGGPANELWGFEQITYRRPELATFDIIGQGEAETDGLRFGIDNNIFGTGIKQHLHSYLRWQEASSFIIQTEDGAEFNIEDNERMRITSIGALTLNYLPTTYIGLTTPTDITRIGVSHDGSIPLSRPMSLMHLGYNIGGTFGPLTLQQGWRSWMDLGMLVSNSTDNIWIGLKPRVGIATAINNEMDAVISWGNDAEGAAVNAGIDVMSFIYTADPISNLDSSVAVSQNGLEIARMYPGKDSTFTYLLNNPTNFYGRLGVGDFTATGVNEQPTHKLDVVGNGRFRYLPDSLYMADSTVNKIVMVDSLGVLRWANYVPGTGLACWDLNSDGIQDTNEDINFDGFWNALDCQGTGGVFNVHNGTSINSSTLPNYIAFGQNVNDPLNPGQLLNDREIPMNNNNIVFTDNTAIGSIGENRIGIGTSSPQARMHIKVNTSIVETAPYAPTALQVNNNQINNSTNTGANIDVSGGSYNSGVLVNTIGGDNNLGFSTHATDGSNRNHAIEAYAQSLNGTQANENYGVISSARLGILNVGGFFEAYSDNQATNENYGVKAVATGMSDYNYGVYAQADGLPNNFAGYFSGAVHVQGNLTIPGGTVTASDIQFKTNVQDLTGAMSLINQLEPRTYDLDTTNYADFNFEADQQMGLVAQEVEEVLPTLVSNHIRPAQYDSLGVQTLPELTYKGVEYEELIPLLIAGMQEQDNRIDSLTTLNGSITNYNDSLVQAVSDLNDRLTLLENCLSNILPALCNANQMAVQQTPEEVQEQLRAAINVNLTDRNAIVLNQNVPNPFAESTIIKFSIPATVQKAQIHFYDGQGKLINSVDIVERGNGQLNVFANDLSSGVYTYSLVADGQIVSTKRMVKE